MNTAPRPDSTGAHQPSLRAQGVQARAAPGSADGPAGPDWLADLAKALHTSRPDQLSRSRPPVMRRSGARPAAVLMLIGDSPDGPDILLIERAPDLRSHAGQPAFPGGATDLGDASPVATALREAQEEVGLDPAGVQVLAAGPALYLPPSHFLVTPVLAWWHTPCPVAPVDTSETSAVARVPVAELADPANRVLVHHARTGHVGPAFRTRGMFIWGFTGGLLDALLRMGGWERPWLPAEQVKAPTPTATGTTEGSRASELGGDSE